MDHTSSPKNTTELLERARQLAGYSLSQLANKLDQPTPTDLTYAKGWVGQLLEMALGADAGNRAEPDFVALGIELKTIPLNQAGLPKESTYVCTVPLNETAGDWQHSWVRQKLEHVLWLPIEADPAVEVSARRIGNAVLTRLSVFHDQQLEQDWNEHMDLISTGRIAEISAHHGTYLQVRPKAANRQALQDSTNELGETIKTLPRGFYLRTTFTAQILAQHYI